jgi:hypothetical protein
MPPRLTALPASEAQEALDWLGSQLRFESLLARIHGAPTAPDAEAPSPATGEGVTGPASVLDAVPVTRPA